MRSGADFEESGERSLRQRSVLTHTSGDETLSHVHQLYTDRLAPDFVNDGSRIMQQQSVFCSKEALVTR